MSTAARACAVGASLLLIAASVRADDRAGVSPARRARTEAAPRSDRAPAEASRRPVPRMVMIPLVGLALLPLTLPFAEAARTAEPRSATPAQPRPAPVATAVASATAVSTATPPSTPIPAAPEIPTSTAAPTH